MAIRVYDTRFFAESFYTKDPEMHRKIENEKRQRKKYTSTVAIHEIYKMTLSREGRETAKLRVLTIQKIFKVIPVNTQIAQLSAELRQKYQLSMGDSMIVATAVMLGAVCVSDDPHFRQVKEIHTAWV